MSQKLNRYIERHSTPPSPVLRELYRQTWLQTLAPRMASGPIQGKFLEMISQMIQPQRILEVGTFTGYSAISLAAGLKKGGKLTTIEHNEELAPLINEYIHKAGMQHQIELIVGNAKTIIPTLNELFDLIFLDADKEAYPIYYPMLIEKLKTGGFLIADNVLWGMKVIDSAANDGETTAIRLFNQMVANDNCVESVILPLRDGLTLIRKLS